MSVRLDGADFSNTLDRALRLCFPAGNREQDAWLDDWKAAVERMHYMNIEHAVITDSLRGMIRIRGRLKKPNLNLDLIKPDVETLWNELTATSDEAAHTIRTADDGFECAFICVKDNFYVTGSISVQRSASKK